MPRALHGVAGPWTRRRMAAAVFACIATLTLLVADGAQPRRGDVEQWRPAVHFTAPRGFMNDPNGLVYADGEYHLFYQHNPFGTRWGHMSWGHAVSADLLRWHDLPIALREQGGWMMFSGSAVADRAGARLAAIYTAHNAARQAQHVAWSTDRGRTWTKDPANPVLDLGLKDFRDPKVFWYEPASEWMMVVSVPDRRIVRFFGSKDLRAWAPRGAFGPAGSTTGVWECPDLLRVPVEGGSPGEHRDVLIVSVNDGAPAGGSGVQYFVGEFTGHSFTAPDAGQSLWADYGPDFYAAQSWSNMPDAASRVVWVGWMSNWRYANEEPTGLPERSVAEPSAEEWQTVSVQAETRGPWRGAMSIPRELALRRAGNGWRVVQRPIREIVSLRSSAAPDVRLAGDGAAPSPQPAIDVTPAADLEVAITFGSARAAGVLVQAGDGEETRVGVDRESRQVFVDRRRSGSVEFHRAFPARDAAPLATSASQVVLRVLIDRSSVEVFADDGATVLTSRMFPGGATRAIRTFADDGRATVEVHGWRLRPAMSR